MKKLYIITMFAFFGLSTNAQFIQYGILAGGGVGGPKGSGLTIKSGINPEFGMFFRYNMTEKISIRTFVNVELHTFSLTGGKQVAIDNSGATSFPYIQNGANYSFNSNGASQHADITYIAIEDMLDFSAGGFWGIAFPSKSSSAELSGTEPRIYYNATDTEILAQMNGSYAAFYTSINSDNPTQLYASDQIKRSLAGLLGGAYAAVTGGTKKIKVMLRYDYGLRNFYKDYSTTNKLKANYLKIGLIYMIN